MEAAGINWVDAAVAVAAVAALLIGYGRGGLKMIATIFGYILSVFVAGRYAGPLLEMADARWKVISKVQSFIGPYIMKYMPEGMDQLMAGAMSPEQMRTMISELPLPAWVIEQLVQQMATFTAGGAGQSVQDLITALIAQALLQGIMFTVIIIVVTMVVKRLFVGLTPALDNVPLGGMINRLLGAGLTFGVTVVSIALLFGVIAPANAAAPNGSTARAVQESRVATWLEPLNDKALELMLNGESGSDSGTDS